MSVEKTICPHCQAETLGVSHCWLCRAELKRDATGAKRAVASLPSSAADHAGDSSGEEHHPYSDANPYAPPVPLADSDSGFGSFSILLVAGLILVFAALFTTAPGVALVLGVVLTPALVRTARVVWRKNKSGDEVSTGEKSVLLMASVGGVLVACLAAIGTFFIACSATCFGGLYLESTGQINNNARNFIPFALTLSACVSLMVGVLVLYRLWTKK